MVAPGAGSSVSIMVISYRTAACGRTGRDHVNRSVVPATPRPSRRSRWHRTPRGRSGWVHANRELCDLTVVDPLRGGTRRHPRGLRRRGSPTTTTRRPTSSRTSRHCRKADRFRFANVLSRLGGGRRPPGRVTGYGYTGGGLMGSTTVAVGGLNNEFEAVALPDHPAAARGRRRVGSASSRRPVGAPACPPPAGSDASPFIQWQAPLVWSTLSLTLHADGTARVRGPGGQPLPTALVLRRARGACRPSPA